MSQNDTRPTSKPKEEEGRDRAIASGWLPAKIVGDWPSLDTRQLIINRRRSLYEAMQDLEAAAARASRLPDWLETVEDAFSTLSAALGRHVAEIEAEDGLFAEVLDRAPRLRPVVDTLREEHDALRRECHSALVMARDSDTEPKVMRRKILAILGRLAMHRQDGAELLFDAHNVDLAAAD